MRALITLRGGSQAELDYRRRTIVPLDALGKEFGPPIPLAVVPIVVPGQPLCPGYANGDAESIGVVEGVVYRR